ncbi:SCP-like protein [Ancylostoma caninum]|uniref:SCP-like protein n=1 Tax=Ancylostoma caninum TaxID=29170 RepID=A0A368GD11_ANCCA|nr:SCP-like protein [Ancylostoma caninum]
MVSFAVCARAQSSGCTLDGDTRKQFLDFHNQKRRDVASGSVKGFKKAKNMYELSWSCELESKARQHISSCPGTVRGLGSTGANNMMWSGSNLQPKQLIKQTLDAWWKPAQQHRLGPDNRYPGGQLFNVANIINAATTQLGCTYNQCGNTLEILCLYDDVAYLTNKILYDTGKPCTKSEECSTYKGSTCNNGLCVKPYEKPDDGTNTMCRNGNVMTDKMRKTILDLHNDFRSLVTRGRAEDKLVNDGKGFTPKGSNMLKMEYDCELEKIASDYARRCIYAHSSPSSRTLRGMQAGENLYTISIDNADKNKAGEWATRSWFSELKEFGVGSANVLTPALWNRRSPDPKVHIQIGHYTQMVWAETDKVGCGIQHCPGVQTLVVCNYLKGGNVMNRKIYELGQPCSMCPKGYKCTADKLCARN